MKRRTLLRIALVFLCAVMLSGSVLALPPDQYRLVWFTPLDTGGGGHFVSDNHTIHLTVGQPALGTLSSTNYKLCLGYWCGAGISYRLYLPLITRHSAP